MKNWMVFLFWVVVPFLVAGCEKKAEQKVAETPKANVQMEEKTTVAGNMHNGVVLTVMNSGGYTYIEVNENGENLWVAVPLTEIKVGEKVSFPDGTWMSQFKSKSLNRTFEKILFIGGINTGSGAAGGQMTAQVPRPQSSIPEAKTVVPPEAGSIEKAKGGYTVEELYLQKKELNGKKVIVRGKVVKVSSNIMRRNWIHIQDGTGKEGSNDITFTSETGTAALGSIIVAEGTFAADKDFGAGYLYPAIVENSIFSK